jgi:hypothetical protein
MSHEQAPRNERGERTWTLVELRDAIERYEVMLTASELARATRHHYVDHATRFADWLEGKYAPRVTKRGGPHGYRFGVESRSKYMPLRDFLLAREDQNAIRLTFRQVEDILRTRLPPSARRYHFWWANDSTGNHAQAVAWIAAGRRVVQLDLIHQTVMFIRADRDYRGGKVRYRPDLEQDVEVGA